MLQQAPLTAVYERAHQRQAVGEKREPYCPVGKMKAVRKPEWFIRQFRPEPSPGQGYNPLPSGKAVLSTENNLVRLPQLSGWKL